MKHLKTILFILISNILLFIALEGFFSTVLVLRDTVSAVYHAPERRFTKYDELLGWSNIPNFEVKDIYAPGVYLKTNSQGFRNNKDFDIKIPEGKIRIICSGDSFTLGHGVDNDHTWCELLSKINKKLETVNLGQAGYGIDQAYLWYKRDGRKLEHNIHAFAFTTEDFDRMKYNKRTFYSKPMLKLVNGDLKLCNVPVPRYSPPFLRLAEHMQRFDEFRFYQFFKRVTKKIYSQKNIKDTAFDSETKAIALKVFETLQKFNEEKKSKLILVYLPSDEDYTDYQPDTDLWRKWLKAEMARRNILFIDLYDDFLQVPFAKAVSLFRKNDCHYSEEGNKFVSEALYKKLVYLDLIPRK